MKQKPATLPNIADPGLAVLCGDAFRVCSEPFVTHAAYDFSLAGQRAAANIGAMVASATNLVLAIEVYLKALLWYHGVSAPKTHELPKLFGDLPPDVRRTVGSVYERLRKSEAAETAATAEFAVHIANPSEGKPNFARSAQRGFDIQAVLQRNASAFVIWRYLFTHPTTTAAEPLIYEFLRLGFIATAIREQLPIKAHIRENAV